MSTKSKRKFGNSFATKAVGSWSVEDVGDWLASLALNEYTDIFESNAISGSELAALTDAELTEIGVKKIGHRKKILDTVSPLSGGSTTKSKGGTTTSSTDSNLNIKATYKGETKKIRLQSGARLSELKEEVLNKFGLKKVSLSYIDEDGDAISISSAEEWAECLSECGNTIKINVTSSSGGSSSGSSSRSSSSRRGGRTSVAAAFSVFDALLQPTFVIDQKGILQYVNDAGAKSTGYEKSGLLGKNVKVMMPEEFAREHDMYLSRYVRTGEARVVGSGRNVTMLTADGSYVPVHLSVTENKATGKTLFVGTLSESQEERKPQTVLSSIREVLDTLVNPAIAITQTGVIQVFNKPAQELWGYNLTEVVGKNVKMLMTDEDSKNHDTYLSNYVNTGVAKIIGTGRDVVGQKKSGELVNLFLSITERKDGAASIFTGVVSLR